MQHVESLPGCTEKKLVCVRFKCICVYMYKYIDKHLFQVSTIDHVTSMNCVRADGEFLPTFLIFSKHMPNLSQMDGTSPNGKGQLTNMIY